MTPSQLAPRDSRAAAFLGVLACVVLWAINYPAMKVALREMDPLAYTGWRFVLASSLFVGWAVASRAPLLPPRGARGLALVLALSGVSVYQSLFARGVALTSGFAAALMNATAPLLALAMVAALGQERPGPLAVTGTVVAYAGVALFLRAARGGDVGSLRGNLLCLGSAACWAVYSVASARVPGRMRAPTALASTFGIGTLVLLLDCAPAMIRQEYGHLSALTLSILALSAVLPLFVAFRLWARGIRVLGVTLSTRLGLLTPVVAGAASAVVTFERFPGAKLAASAVVLAGLALTRLDRKPSGAVAPVRPDPAIP